MSNAARPTLGLPKPAAKFEVVDETPSAAVLEAAEAAPEPAQEEQEAARRDARRPAPVEVTLAPTPNPRLEALNRLADQADVETGNAAGVAFDERTELERPVGDDGLHEDPAVPMLVADPGAEPGEDPGAAPAAPATVAKTFKVDIRGQVAEVPEDKVIEAGLHALRHHGAAEMALREANALLTQARGVAGPAPTQPTNQPAPASTPEDALKLAEALQFGSKEDAAKAVAAMMSRGVASEDVNDVVARTVETRVRDVLDQDKAAKQLESLVPEMLTDRRILALMATEERAARAAGDTRPYTQLYPEIGQKIRGWIDGMKPAASAAQAQAPAAPIAARVAAKAAVASPVSGRGASPAASAQPKQPTGSEIIAEMRKMRHQRQVI